jgi:hypothetical protein
MASTLAYVIDDLRTSRRAEILEEFRSSGHILELFAQGLREVQTLVSGRIASFGGEPAGPE